VKIAGSLTGLLTISAMFINRMLGQFELDILGILITKGIFRPAEEEK